MKLKEIKPNGIGTVECVIVTIEEKTNRNNGTFLNIGVSDGESQVIAKKWNEKVETFMFKPGQAVLIEVKMEEYKGEPSYIIREITESSADPSLFICGAPLKSEYMYNFLYKTAGRCGVYASTVRRILAENKDKLMIWGAGRSIHHNIRGGLLYHTYRMTKMAAYTTSVYNKEPSMLKDCRDINTELLVAGTILHDIGKLCELDTNEFGASEYTVKGTLMGHAFIGAELAGRVAREEGLDEEDIMLLQHLILSHHGKHEYEAVTVPAIPEALVLHHIDTIDSYMYQFETQAEGLKPGEMSGKVFGLDQRVYRPTWRVPQKKEEGEEKK